MPFSSAQPLKYFVAVFVALYFERSIFLLAATVVSEGSVVSAIYEYYDALYLKNLEDQLSESLIIKKERLPLYVAVAFA